MSLLGASPALHGIQIRAALVATLPREMSFTGIKGSLQLSIFQPEKKYKNQDFDLDTMYNKSDAF